MGCGETRVERCRVIPHILVVPIGATPEPYITYASNGREAPPRPEMDPELAGGPDTGPPLVGDTGIEPVTPTVSMLSPERWLHPLTLDIPVFLDLRCWLPSLTMVRFGCRVAPMWPEPICADSTAG